QNLGVIPNEAALRVKLKHRVLGLVEESFIRQIAPGDVFLLAGRPVRLERVGVMEAFVTRADHATPTVTRWNANKMPLTNKVAEEIVKFRSELRQRLEAAGTHPSPVGPTASAALEEWIAARLDCGANNARIILQTHVAQHELSEIPTADFILVEEFVSSGEETAATAGDRP